MLCVCSDINIIIKYTKVSMRAEEIRGPSLQQTITVTYHKPLVADLTPPTPMTMWPPGIFQP